IARAEGGGEGWGRHEGLRSLTGRRNDRTPDERQRTPSEPRHRVPAEQRLQPRSTLRLREVADRRDERVPGGPEEGERGAPPEPGPSRRFQALLAQPRSEEA